MGGIGSGRPEPAKRGGDGKYGKGGCFIATAVYGDSEAPEVLVLRRFRDEVLMKFLLGRGFIAAYYRLSPPIAGALRSSPTAQRFLRRQLDIMVQRIGRFDRHAGRHLTREPP